MGRTRHPLNPKFGILWNITPDTIFRIAVFKTLKRSEFAKQTIEPTQVAGFNQFFDDFYGTESWRWGAGVDHRFSPNLAAGAEASKRELDVPITSEITDEWEESVYRLYCYWTPHPRWVASIEYFREDFDNLETGGPLDTETQLVPVGVSYFAPSGIFAKVRVSSLNQQVALGQSSDSDGATFVDLGVGYRLPHRWGIWEVQMQNVLNQDYRFEGQFLRSPGLTTGVPPFLPFPPEFTAFVRITLAF